MDTPHLNEHPLLAALMACTLFASAVSAQPATPQLGSNDHVADQEMRVSTTMIALLAAVIAVFVLIAASIIYLRHCTGYSYAHAARPSDRAAPATDNVSFSTFFARRLQRRTRGLDAEVVEAFPTMRYAEAKALRVGKKALAALECAVCLSEFDDDERLRLLPRCSHAFHPDCIGEWLASHVTCPVCRCNLDPSKDTGSDDEPSNPNPPPAAPEANSTSSEITVARRHQEQEDGARAGPVPALVIDVLTDEEAEQRRKEAMELQRIGTQRRAMRSRPKTGKLVRSHSTGHSALAVVQLDRDLERFTLRLPEHLRREMIAAGEQSSRRGQRGEEGSSRGGRLGRSGNWPSSFLRYTRTLSGRFFSGPRRTDSSEGGEVSSSSSTRIRGKRVAAIDFADSSAVGGGVPGAKVGSVGVDVDKASGRQVRT